MIVSIPEVLKNWAEARVAEGSYSSTSDYFRDLVRRDRADADATARLRQAWSDGVNSGPAIPGTFDVDDIAARGAARLNEVRAAE